MSDPQSDEHWCEWVMGKVGVGTFICRRPAKAQASAPWHHKGSPILVCGIHANRAVRIGYDVKDGLDGAT